MSQLAVTQYDGVGTWVVFTSVACLQLKAAIIICFTRTKHPCHRLGPKQWRKPAVFFLTLTVCSWVMSQRLGCWAARYRHWHLQHFACSGCQHSSFVNTQLSHLFTQRAWITAQISVHWVLLYTRVGLIWSSLCLSTSRLHLSFRTRQH